MALPTVGAVFGVFAFLVKNFVIHFFMSKKRSGTNVWV